MDWDAGAAESMEYFLELLRTDTSNPPGNETEAATYLQGLLEREGIETELFALDPARANLVARLRGNGSKQPILIMGHTDVVGVQRDNWSVDPFAAVTQDGYVYGRGALDDPRNARSFEFSVRSTDLPARPRIRCSRGRRAPVPARTDP